MSVIEWSETPQLGGTATDANHVKFYVLLNAVIDTSDAEFISTFGALVDHTEYHFAEESAWMDTTDFPPRHCHRGEHDNVLVFCCEVRKRTAAGEVELGRRLMTELSTWFVQHIDVMDCVVTMYLAQMDNTMRTIEHVG